MKKNNVLTATRMTCELQCSRKHFWRYEIGLTRDSVGLALRVGSAWSRAMESRWKGENYLYALKAALPKNVQLDQYYCEIIAAMLKAYYEHWQGKKEVFRKMYPEEQFGFELGFGDFTVEGKLDGLGILKSGRGGILEAKTTSDSVMPDATYWQRLKFNMQLLQYADAAIEHNDWDISKVIYDVMRKPSIRPKEINEVDKKGIPIVRGLDGKRVIKKNKELKKTADKKKGESIRSHLETPAKFADRLYNDVKDRPEFYFARKEVSILEGDLVMFRNQRMAIAHRILSARSLQEQFERDGIRPEEAWPRSVFDQTCNFCDFKPFCLQNLEVDKNNIPEGYSIKAFNPELEPKITAQDDSMSEI